MTTREQKMWERYRAAKLQRQLAGDTRAPQKTRQPDKVRFKDWAELHQDDDPDAYDDLDIAARERVMPEGETEWLRANVIRSPLHRGFGEQAPVAAARDQAEDTGRLATGAAQAQGAVIEISSGLATVALDGRPILCTLRKSLRIAHSGYGNMLAVGDEVLITHNGDRRGVVEAILPRRSALARPDPFNAQRQQVIVANVDQALIVAAWREPAFWPELADRYLIAAQRHNLRPTLCINKVDLAAPGDPALDATASAYRAAGYDVLLTSAVQGVGLDALAARLQGKTTALAGLSGVGKSSLLNAAEPGLDLRIGEVNERRHEGRHTTTQVTLHPLRNGGFVVDTPGIREFGLAGLTQPALAGFYPEFHSVGPCAYANCSHMPEPACAVKAAVRDGRLSRMRYESYTKIWHDLTS